MPAALPPIPPSILVHEGDQVWVSVVSHFDGRLAGPPADRAGKIAINLPRPGQWRDRAADQWYEMTPRIAVELLLYAGKWFCIDAPTLARAGVAGEYGLHVAATAVWFLDTYWPPIRRGINRTVNLPAHRWPSNVNPMLRLLSTVGKDSQYASLGARAIDWVREAFIGTAPTPTLSIDAPDRTPYSDEPPEMAQELDRQWRAGKEHEWWVEAGGRVSALANKGYDRLADVGPVGEDDYTAWVRGLQGELLAVEAFISPDLERPGEAPSPTSPPSPDPAPPALKDVPIRREVWFGVERLAINAHADYAVLTALLAADGHVVTYPNLLRCIKPNELAASVNQMNEAPQEVKDAVNHINKALRDARAPWKAESVRKYAYKLTLTTRPDEQS